MKKKYDFQKEWPKIKKQILDLSQDAMDLVKKGEKEAVRLSHEAKRHLDSTAISLKKERLLYLIGKEYILPRALEEAGLSLETIKIDEVVWPAVVRPLGFDAGMRTLERTISGLCRKVAKMIIEGKGRRFHITSENMKDYLPKW